MSRHTQDIDRLARLDELCHKAKSKPRALSDEELADLPRLYRGVASIASRLTTRGDQPAAIRESRRVLQAAHAQLHGNLRGERAPWYRRSARFVFIEAPQAIRAEWKLVMGWTVLFWGLFGLGWALVASDLSLAFQLGDPGMASGAIHQLDGLEEGEAWEGNFTFGFGASSGNAGKLIGHNLGVAMFYGVMGIAPPMLLWLIARFALMIGAYVGLASHWGQDTAIFSLLMCHGTFELMALLLSGSAGTIFARALVLPGGYTRSHALRLAAGRALRVFAPCVPLLVVAGLIEGFVSPHAPTVVRLSVATMSLVVLILWFGFVGRDPRSARSFATAAAPVSSTARGSRS